MFYRLFCLITLIILSSSFLALGSADRLEDLSRSIVETKDLIKNLGQKVKDLAAKKVTLESQISDINSLLANLGQDLQVLELEISKINNQLLKLENEIDLLNIKIQQTELKLSNLKTEVADLIALIYVKNQNFDLFELDSQTLLKIIFSDSSSSEILNEISFISTIENLIHLKVAEVADSLSDLEDYQLSLLEIQQSKISLLKELAIQKDNLTIQKQTQEQLLDQKRRGILNYQQLIAASKAQELAAQRELSQLEVDYTKVSRQISKANQSTDDFDSKKTLFAWPIYPKKGISAGFKDPHYHKVIGIEHLAIDIPAPQQSQILAPANGKVLKVKNSNNNSYNYIILAHNQGYTTLYGHVYKSLVIEGQFVKKGQVIGYSGGSPGTRGAGYLTTGAHLHFEVHKLGKHLNPYHYLDTSILK